MAEVLLSLEGVAAGYGPDRDVIAALDLDLRAGRMVGLLGANGSGKSTAVRLASGWLRPRRGRVLLGGEDLAAMSRARAARRIALVPQREEVGFDFSVRELVALGRLPERGWWRSWDAADEAAIEEALGRAELAGLEDRSVRQLSGGEWQRVLLARALAQGGDVLLMDEPLTHLDLQHQTSTLRMARALAVGKGVAVLVVLHDWNLATAYCDELVVLERGAVAARGQPADVVTAARLATWAGAGWEVVRTPEGRGPWVLPAIPKEKRS